jgi:RNA polymerase sporulation-specific sigma factor
MATQTQREAAWPFCLMPDEDVIPYARAGHVSATEYLLTKYRGLVEGKARTYYLAGSEHEDVVQEGMIGLYKAIRDFSGLGRSAFRSFAELCVTRQIITAVKTSTRHKHQVFNQCVSLESGAVEEEDDLQERLVDLRCEDPEEVAMARSFCREILGRVQVVLSDFEAEVLAAYLQGMSYKGMARRLGCRVKAIDNALQRSKKKLAEAVGE